MVTQESSVRPDAVQPDEERLPPVTPGEVLGEEFMAPLGLSARALAHELGVPSNRISAILNGERGITAATALLLARRFGTSPEFWMNLQTAHDLELARQAEALAERHGVPLAAVHTIKPVATFKKWKMHRLARAAAKGTAKRKALGGFGSFRKAAAKKARVKVAPKPAARKAPTRRKPL